jgi:hypothetical protein
MVVSTAAAVSNLSLVIRFLHVVMEGQRLAERDVPKFSSHGCEFPVR